MGSVIGYPEAHGAAATFETDVAEKIKSLIVDVEPVQDLHGYDSPWPAGGGKNLANLDVQFPATQNGVTFTKNDDGSITINGTASANVTFILMTEKSIANGAFTISGVPVNTAGNDFRIWARNTIGGSEYSSTRNGISGTVNISTGTIYIYCTISSGVSVNNVTVYLQLESGSTATTWTPYSNICPITGWTKATITHHGKNMAQYWQQGYIGTDGSIKTGSTYAMAKPVFVQNGRPIAVSNTAGDYQGIAVFSDSSLENMIYRLANTASTYTASQDCYVVFWFNKVYSEYTESDFINRGVQIEFDYSATVFEPYSHDEYDITFPNAAGIVYGCKVNAISGELIVDKAIVDLGTLDWVKANIGYFRSDSIKALIAAPVGQKTPADILCSKYSTLSYSQVNTMTISGIAVIGDTSANDIGRITINDLTLSDLTAEDFKSSLSGTMLVYKMNTPITYSLTPKEIDTIIGTNTIYSDTGDVSVLYPKTLTPAETVSNVSLMELRRNIIAAQAYEKTVDVTLNLETHQVYPTDSIESLRKYLTVVSRGNGTAVTDYTLRGNISTIGNHQIIVDCHPGIAAIQVPVVANPSGILYEWNFTKSLTDERQNYTAILKTGEADEVPGKSAGTTPPVRLNTGVVFNNAQQVLRLLDSDIDSSSLLFGKTLEVDVAEFNYIYNGTIIETEPRRACFIMFGDPLATPNKGAMLYTRGIILNNEWIWRYWAMRRENEPWTSDNILLNGKNAISGHNIGLYINDNGLMNFYVDGAYTATTERALPSTDLYGLQIGAGGRPQYGGAFYNARITGVRIYDGNVYNS